ncbi:MAG: cobalamin-dependent protein [Planctomycetaceae bacterium]|nr:cobalamin-dependent protein [Planctomycetaceae bacterium]
MKIKFILPALEEAKSPFWRPIKYSLFPPLGLAMLAAYCDPDDELTLVDEHVEELETDDSPDLVVIQVYITNAYRAYEIADQYRSRGVVIAMGGLHVTAIPEEAKQHADVVFLGPGEECFARFLREFKNKSHATAHPVVYQSNDRSLVNGLMPRRDLFKRERYLVPNSLVISRGCVNRCDFCYSNSFYRGGKQFYTYRIDHILQEIESLPGRHLYFLDDHLFADRTLTRELFRQMRGMNRLFQGAATVNSVLDDDLIELAYDAGFRSAFIGFESLEKKNLTQVGKTSNLDHSYREVIKRLDSLGIMINGSYIFGMDHDTKDVFKDVTHWAIDSGIATATFHLMTPYPDTSLWKTLESEGRITCRDWRKYDTRHSVFRHPMMSSGEIEEGYHWAYREFYKWRNIYSCSRRHETLRMRWKHLIYAGSWKKFEPVWNFIIKNRMLCHARKILERTLQ